MTRGLGTNLKLATPAAAVVPEFRSLELLGAISSGGAIRTETLEGCLMCGFAALGSLQRPERPSLHHQIGYQNCPATRMMVFLKQSRLELELHPLSSR